MITARNRWHDDGSCSLCSGGWLCGACQSDAAERDERNRATLAKAAAGIRSEDIARTCARFELESDEGGTREEKAARMIDSNQGT